MFVNDIKDSLEQRLRDNKFDYVQRIDASIEAGKCDIYAIRNDRLFLFKVYDSDNYENMMDSVIRLEHDKTLYGIQCFDTVLLYYVHGDDSMKNRYYCERTNGILKKAA